MLTRCLEGTNRATLQPSPTACLLITYQSYSLRLLAKSTVGTKVTTSGIAQTLGSADALKYAINVSISNIVILALMLTALWPKHVVNKQVALTALPSNLELPISN